MVFSIFYRVQAFSIENSDPIKPIMQHDIAATLTMLSFTITTNHFLAE